MVHLITSFPVDSTATLGGTYTVSLSIPAAAAMPISDAQRTVPFSRTVSPLLMSQPMGLNVCV